MATTNTTTSNTNKTAEQAALLAEYRAAGGQMPERILVNGALGGRAILVSIRESTVHATGRTFQTARFGHVIGGDEIDRDPVADVSLTPEQYAALADAAESLAGEDLPDGGRKPAARWSIEGAHSLRLDLYRGKDGKVHASYKASDRAPGQLIGAEAGFRLVAVDHLGGVHRF